MRHGWQVPPPGAPQDAGDRLFQRLAGLLVDDAKDALDRLAGRFLGLPAGEGRSHGIDEIDAAFGIGGDHGIADAGERHPQPFALLVELAVGLVLVQRQLDLDGQFPLLERFEDVAERVGDLGRSSVAGSEWAVR